MKQPPPARLRSVIMMAFVRVLCQWLSNWVTGVLGLILRGTQNKPVIGFTALISIKINLRYDVEIVIKLYLMCSQHLWLNCLKYSLLHM